MINVAEYSSPADTAPKSSILTRSLLGARGTLGFHHRRCWRSLVGRAERYRVPGRSKKPFGRAEQGHEFITDGEGSRTA